MIGHPPVQRIRWGGHLRQLGRFCGVGLICLAFSLAVLVGLHTYAKLNYLTAYAASFIAGNIAGYLLNARFTFSVGTVSHTGAVRYMAVNGALLCVSTALMRLMVGEFHAWYIDAALLVAALNTPISFLAQRFVTYRIGAMDSTPNR